ncbi:MAG: NAD-dependent epimerase/dehydratase family protein [Chloroflexi bacterium]|nr:NAD-dependent epimerase/dehydratase family protein [Chloroflexota bacterium]
MKLAITGVSGYLGKKAVEALEREPAVSDIIGLDIADPGFDSSKFRFNRLDIRSPDLAGFLKNARPDSVLHLAWIFNPSHDYLMMYDVNVNGTLNLMTACRQAGVRHIVLVGSTTCYGAHPDNPEWIEEDHPLRGNPDFPYAHHKVIVEKFCDQFEKNHPEIAVTRLRACIVLGKNVDNFIRTLILVRGFRHALAKGHNPAIQFLHEDDLARVLAPVLVKQPRGAYNVTPDDTLPVRQIAEIARNRFFEYPPWFIRPLMASLWFLRLLPVPASYLPFVMYRWTAGNSRIKRELGWQPAHSTRSALTSVPGIHPCPP